MLTVTTATRADVDELATLLATAFQEDPSIRALLGTDRPDLLGRAVHLHRAMLTVRPIGAGTVDVARDGARTLGVAIWYAPGDLAVPLGAQLLHLRDYVGAFGPTGLRRALRITKAVAQYHPATPHWYLQSLGVSPAARGLGVGSALLAHRLAIADAAGDAAYLESSTPRTGRLYLRHGFTPLRPITAWPGARPWAMWRPGGGA